MSYDGIAREYDAAFDWESEPERILPLWRWLGEPARVIEAACGPARLLSTLVANGVHGIGVDMSEPMLALARAHLGATGGRYELHNARLERFAVDAPCDAAFCAVGSFGHLDSAAAAGAHLDRMRAALAPGGRYAIQLWLQPLRDTLPSEPNEHSTWTFELDGDELRYSWYGTGIDAAAMRELQRSRIEWLTGPRTGTVVETDHVMAIWDWPGWQRLAAEHGFRPVACVEFDDGAVTEHALGPGLYDYPVVWHVLERL